jgi:hypothetical protein
VVHAAIGLGAYRPEIASERVPAEPLWMELQIQEREPVSAPASPAASFERDAQHAQQGRSPPRERFASPRAAGVTQHPVAPVEAAPESSAAAVVQDAIAEQAGSGQRAPTLDLSPLAAARTLGDSTYAPLRDAGVARGDDVPLSPTAQANALAQQVPGLRASKGSGRSVEGVVVDVVEDTLYNVLRPWKLLQRTMRGSQYRYAGGGFDAAIMPDGRVRFRDKDGPTLTVSATHVRETGPSSQAIGPAPTGGLSLGDPRALWHRVRGKDPFAAERRLFLERTRALREYLSGRAAERGVPTEDESSQDVESEPLSEPPVGQ